MVKKRRGVSYRKRVGDINRMFDHYARKGLSNREIWRRYIYPTFGISERSLYNILNASVTIGPMTEEDEQQLLLFDMREEQQ